MSKEESRSKKLAFLLRHDTNYAWDGTGWRTVANLLEKYGYTMYELTSIVSNDNKGRYEFNVDKTMIRATQGHSIPGVDPDLKEIDADCKIDILYHGTSSRFVDAINREGLKPMTRNYVQLSHDIETASTVGLRHGGELVIYEVKLAEMLHDGIPVFISKNGVYMTKRVLPKYLEKKNGPAVKD